MAEKIRIKDIAERAGVSVGTVDRVLHKRPNVSAAALKRVEKVLKEMDYQPNVYASALAYNKSYTFYCLLPKHASEIETGALKAVEMRRDFDVDLEIMYYSRLDSHSFITTYQKCLKKNPDGVILVPTTLELTRPFTDELHERNIPFILLDSYMPSLQPLSFYGQDSILKTGRRNVQIMGYDMVHKNADCLRAGSIFFLIAQHAYQQGFFSVDSLFHAIVLKKKVEPVNYMPIDLLTPENIEFYHRSWG